MSTSVQQGLAWPWPWLCTTHGMTHHQLNHQYNQPMKMMDTSTSTWHWHWQRTTQQQVQQRTWVRWQGQEEVVPQAHGRWQGWDGWQWGKGRGWGWLMTTPGAAEPPHISCVRGFYFYLISFMAPPSWHSTGQIFISCECKAVSLIYIYFHHNRKTSQGEWVVNYSTNLHFLYRCAHLCCTTICFFV